MLEKVLVDNVWLTATIWAVIYISDYYVTIYAARLYQVSGKEHFVFAGSLELTPYFQDDVDNLRRFSPRFLWRLILSAIAILTIWLLSVRFLEMRALFSLLIGGLFLREATIHIRHIRNIVLFRYAKNPEDVKGTIEYSRRFVLRQSATELLSFAMLFLLMYWVAGNWFFLGGALACTATGQQHWAMAKRVSLHTQQA
jgi:hypothetical protein